MEDRVFLLPDHHGSFGFLGLSGYEFSPGFTGNRVLGTTRVDPLEDQPKIRPHSLWFTVSISLDLCLSLSPDLSISLISLSVSLSHRIEEEETRKKKEEKE
jgi:hypothetical protein